MPNHNRTRNSGARLLSAHGGDPIFDRAFTSNYAVHLTEAERIALRICEGGVPTKRTEVRAERQARTNERLRPRRFSWEQDNG